MPTPWSRVFGGDSMAEIILARAAVDIAAAVALDARHMGHGARAAYIRGVAADGGLYVAKGDSGVEGFCCLDHRYFFHKPFISLLNVAPAHRRRGIGRRLLRFVGEIDFDDLWTSTNESNAPMRTLLAAEKWRPCGAVHGLDADDPELFFRKPV